VSKALFLLGFVKRSHVEFSAVKAGREQEGGEEEQLGRVDEAIAIANA
jgi:hypothetical protein